MADAKITALTAMTSLSADDLLVAVDDPAGSATTKKITYANLSTGIKLGNLWLSSRGLTVSSTSGATSQSQTESATNKENRVTLSYVDGSTTYAEIDTVMPTDYDGGTFTAKFYWLASGTSTNSVRWQIEARSFGDSETLDQAYGTAVAVDDAHTATANQVMISAATAAVTAAGTPAGGELMFFRVARLGGHANDNLAVTVELLGVLITYTRS